EIMAVTDRVTVMRAGAVIETVATAETSQAAIAESMVGRKVALQLEKAAVAPGPAGLEGEHLSVGGAAGPARVRAASFAVRGGEIVGIAGVTGNGQTELLEALAGMLPLAGGTIRLHGEVLPPEHGSDGARAMRRRHVAHVPEDRQRQGLIG